jgi:hypothetical protein
MTTPSLPDDVARCSGVGSQDDDGWDWREGCEDCLRRTVPSHSMWPTNIAPPSIIVFECPYRIAP